MKKLLGCFAVLLATSWMAANVQAQSSSKDIVDTAVGAKQFSTLVAAVKAAGLVETLKGDGRFTVFAPNDYAFKKVPKETLESLLKPENKEKLQKLLKYHVVSGKVLAKDVVSMSEAETVEGSKCQIKVSGNTVMIDNAKVLKTDILCEHGVIHVIDAVIMPGAGGSGGKGAGSSGK